jgi:hypothetical protein
MAPKLTFDYSRIDTNEVASNQEYLEELRQIQDMMKSIKNMNLMP